MPRGGKREGAGRKPRVQHYERRHSVGRRELKIGQRCEVLWREAYDKGDVAGMHWSGAKRPRARKPIIQQVADEFGETRAIVERLWKEYRRLEADLGEDLAL